MQLTSKREIIEREKAGKSWRWWIEGGEKETAGDISGFVNNQDKMAAYQESFSLYWFCLPFGLIFYFISV